MVQFSKAKASFIWKKCWRPALTLLFPILLSVIFLWKGMQLPKKSKDKDPIPKWKQPRAAFVIFLLAVYWVSECLPLPVTALCPVFLLPLMDVMDTGDVTQCYLNSSVMLLLSGCIIAQAFEYSNLHTRIALKVITLIGVKIPVLLLGIMMTAMFLSMWMNNTSTTAMMVPIVYVIMKEFENVDIEDESSQTPPVPSPEIVVTPPSDTLSTALVQKRSQSKAMESVVYPVSNSPPVLVDSRSTAPVSKSHAEMQTDDLKKKRDSATRNLKIMFLLGVAWASNIGGTGIITGTATNIIAQNQVKAERENIEKKKPDYTNPEECLKIFDINFLGWMKFNVVPMFIGTLATWVILLLWFTGLPGWVRFWKKNSLLEQREESARKTVAQNIEKAINAKYQQLGVISLHEIFVVVLFTILVVLWVGGGESGWWVWFEVLEGEKYYPNAAVPAMLVCIFLFVLPKETKYYRDFMKGGLGVGLKDPVLPWREVETKVPWGPLILIGGGVAISAAISKSGLGAAIGIFLRDNEALNALKPWQFLIIVLIIVALLTAIASNTATAAILSPVLVSLAFNKGIHPLYLLEVATVAASYAFVLPISTPPNAIIFDKSDMKQIEMAKPGLIVTLVTNILLFIMVHTYNELIYDFSGYKKVCMYKE